MARSYFRQSTQIRKSDTYNDAVVGDLASMVTNAVTVEDDLNALRSQVKRITGETNWYLAPTGRTLKTVATDLTDLEGKKLLFRAQVLADIPVTVGQNYVVLSVASSQAPSETAAVGTGTANGAVVAVLAGATGSHALTLVAGTNNISPKNLCLVRNAVTGEVILSGGKEVHALIQAASGTVDGNTFDDTTKRVQLSFVRENTAGDALEAAPVGDIGGKTINYAYVRRINLDAVPEQAFLSGNFIDNLGAVDVTLQNAVVNQGATTVDAAQNLTLRFGDGTRLSIWDSIDGELLNVNSALGGSSVAIGAPLTGLTANFSGTVTASTADPVSLMLDGGTTEAALSAVGGALRVSCDAAEGTYLKGGTKGLFLNDGNKAGTWSDANGIKLSAASSEWAAFETAFGEVSLLAAVTAASGMGGRTRYTQVVGSDVAADTDFTVTGLSYSAANFVAKVNVYLGGQLLTNGADAAANNDVYPGTAPANGHLKFEFGLKVGDVISVEVYT